MEKTMLEVEKSLIDAIKDGQSGEYKNFVRSYTSKVRQIMELKNPLDAAILVDKIEAVLEIIDPLLTEEIGWFKRLIAKLKLWHNEMVIANRLLGLKNDNEYDMSVFEKVVIEKFHLYGKKLKPETKVQTDYKSMIELVEMGARRFTDR